MDFLVRNGRWWHVLIVGTALANVLVAGLVAVGAETQAYARFDMWG